jgi:hypothetical protein
MADIVRPRLQASGATLAAPITLDVDSLLFTASVDRFNLLIVPEQAGTGFLDVTVRLAGTSTYFALVSSITGEPMAFSLAAPDVLVLEGLDVGSIRLTPRIVVGVVSVGYSLGGISDV